MTVRLIHDRMNGRRTRDGLEAPTRLLELPKWHKGRNTTAQYWHIPRSAILRPDGRISASYWCGQVHSGNRRSTSTDTDPPHGWQCGTCVGRYEGAMVDGATVFSPRDVFDPPPICPGNDRDADGLCTACRRPVNWGKSSGYYAPDGTARHTPGPGLIDTHAPCYWHGWERMWEPTGGVLRCSPQSCTHRSLSTLYAADGYRLEQPVEAPAVGRVFA